jgi:RimJ/RimL family protein N-acetyltransferase
MSRSEETIDKQDHLRWFAKAVDDPNRLLFIAIENGRKIGMIRFDHTPDAWTVSINLAPAFRRQGYGSRALKKAIDAAGPIRLVAEIKTTNVASRRTFEKCGFRRESEINGFEQWCR